MEFLILVIQLMKNNFMIGIVIVGIDHEQCKMIYHMDIRKLYLANIAIYDPKDYKGGAIRIF